MPKNKSTASIFWGVTGSESEKKGKRRVEHDHNYLLITLPFGQAKGMAGITLFFMNNQVSTSVSSIRDNRQRGSVGKFLEEKIESGASLSIVSAYFTIYAYQYLKEEMNGIANLRFLFGEPTFLRSIDPAKANKKGIGIEDENLVIGTRQRLGQRTQAKECAEWLREKAEIKSMVKPNFLHGKCYLVNNTGKPMEGIMGSSNFTVNGLGLGGSPNIELNMEVQDKRDLIDLQNWFNEVWNDDPGLVEDVKERVLQYLEQMYVENEPEFIYYKTLYHIFYKHLEEQKKNNLLDERTGFYDSEIWNQLYPFQQDGVKGAINKILRHNGCIIADSVGLGKTFEALAVIRYFELQNYRVLVLCPKKLADNWTVYQASKHHTLNPFKKDRFAYSVLYHTDLGRVEGRSAAEGVDFQNFNWANFDLVVIDESHNFRGNPVEKTADDGSSRMNRAKWLMEKIIKSGAKTRVLLLSATPVNNTLRDLRNQILLITEGENNALYEATQIKDISQTLKVAQTHFTNWADRLRNPDRTVKQLLETLDSSFFKLLDELTIARSRKHICSFYDLSAIGPFPERLKPQSVYPIIDRQDRFFTYDALNRKIHEYKLSLFNPSGYVKEDKQQKYEDMAGRQILAFRQADREHFLINMMKVNFLKRLESSVKSFEISMDRTISKIERLQKKIKEFLHSGAASQVENLEQFEPDEAELEENPDDLEQWQVGKKLKFDLADLNLDRWLDHLEKDRQALIDLYNSAHAVSVERDAKLHDLKGLITRKISQPLNEGNRKVIVFTAFADTAGYLFNCLKDWARIELGLHIALVAGSTCQTTYGKNDFNSILTNFSPISKRRAQIQGMSQDGEIDLLIATDCISEGQNLQDCDYLVNYDIHWNPVRIIQRFGRIDRLGSKNNKIQLVNFWPTPDLDNYINLKERVEARMALVDVTATGEDNILNVEQLEDLITEDLKYRNRQLLRLKDEVLDLEEMNEGISLTDFTLDDFRMELANFLDRNRKRLEEAPMGLYAVVPAPAGLHAHLIDSSKFSPSEKDIIKPGVVFCLCQKGDTEGNEQVNPLQPYFLVYIRQDGTVRYNYTNAKQILEIYRLMCQGQREPFYELCELFNTETERGTDMSDFSELLQRAVREISRMFKKRSNSQLISNRSGLVVPHDKQAREVEDFDLITWLVIK